MQATVTPIIIASSYQSFLTARNISIINHLICENEVKLSIWRSSVKLNSVVRVTYLSIKGVKRLL